MAGSKRRKVETKVCFHIDDEETPYLVKIPIALGKLTLRDFKRSLPRTNFKFFFKSVDPEFGVVKEEITNDSAVLPAFKGRVVSWLVTEKITRNATLRGSQQRALGPNPINCNLYETIPSRERLCSVGSSTDSASIELKKILETSSPDPSSRLTSHSLETVFSQKGREYENYPTLRRHEVLMPSVAASTLSAADLASEDQNPILVELSLTESEPNLGIQVANSTDGELLIDTIVEGSPVCLDGRISVGDELLSINDTSLQHLSSRDAIQVMRSITSTTREVSLLINKRSPYGELVLRDALDLDQGKLIRPCDPGAWVAHTEAALQKAALEDDFTQILLGSAPAAGLPPTATEKNRELTGADERSHLETLSGIVEAMARPDSGIRIKDRKWLSYHFKNAVVGSEIVDWLQRYGTFQKKQAKLLARKMFDEGLIRNPMIKDCFNKKSIYTFSDEIDLLYQKALDKREREKQGTAHDTNDFGEIHLNCSG